MRNKLVTCEHCGDEVFIDHAVYVDGTGKKVAFPRCQQCHEKEVRNIPLTNMNRHKVSRQPGSSDRQYKGSVLEGKRP